MANKGKNQKSGGAAKGKNSSETGGVVITPVKEKESKEKKAAEKEPRLRKGKAKGDDGEKPQSQGISGESPPAKSTTAPKTGDLGSGVQTSEELDYEEDIQEPSNSSNSAQLAEEEGTKRNSSDSEGGSSVHSKTPKNSELSRSGESEVFFNETPKRRLKRKDRTQTIRGKRRRRIQSSSSSSSSESDSESSESSSEESESEGTDHEKTKRKGKGKHLKRKRAKRRSKARRNKLAKLAKKRAREESEEEIKGITASKLKKMMEEYFETRKAEDQQRLMGAVPDVNGQLVTELSLNNGFNRLHINGATSDTTVYTRGIKSVSASQNMTDTLDLAGVIGPRTTSDSDNLNSDKNLNSSGDSNELSFAGRERAVPSPPTQINDDTELATAMNRPEWTKAIDKAQEEADRIIREAERSKARMVKPSGELPLRISSEKRAPINVIDSIPRHKDTDNCDELVRHVSAHIDDNLRHLIRRGGFVEISRLVPKEKGTSEGGKKLKLTNDDGETYYIPPAGDTNPNAINSFRKWERYFRVYAEIYSTANPSKAGEILQYMDSIENAANLYAWENVEKYDRLFRQHMEKFPHRKWSDRYKSAYEEEMKEPLSLKLVLNSVRKQTNSNGNRKINNACWRFNKHGKCDLGAACSMEHKCAHCGKFGHAKKDCFKLNPKHEKGVREQPYSRKREK